MEKGYLRALIQGQILINAKLNHPNWVELSSEEKDKAVKESMDEITHVSVDRDPYQNYSEDSIFCALWNRLEIQG